ncbi:MAG: hypothetical protein R3F53_19205 [Gammaproteobacteria bacterium]
MRSGGVPRTISVTKKGPLTLQCDEVWSFVGHKGNKQWVWLALDVESREIGVYVGSRDEAGARGCGPRCPVSIANVPFVTDFWAAYALNASRQTAFGPSAKKVVTPAILSVSMARYASG